MDTVEVSSSVARRPMWSTVSVRFMDTEFGKMLMGEVDGIKQLYPIETVAHILLLGYEKVEKQIAMAVYEKSDRVLEAGAGLGGVTTMIARQSEFVRAHEPLMDQLQICAANLRLNEVTNVELHSAVIGPADGAVMFHRMAEPYGSSVFGIEGEPSIEQIELPCVDIGAAVREDRLNAIHMDIEGGEAWVLDNGADLSGIDVLTMEVHPRMIGVEKTDEMLARILGWGFQMAIAVGAYNYPRHTYSVCFARDAERVVRIRARAERDYEDQLSVFEHLL